MLIILFFIFLVSLSLSFLITWIARQLAIRYSFLDHPGQRKNHQKPIPQGGGIALWLTTTTVVVGGSLIAFLQNQGFINFNFPPFLSVHLSGISGVTPLLLRIFGGGMAIALLGLFDDIHPINSLFKLFLQVLIVSAVVLTGKMRISLFIPSAVLQTVVTILWIVLITNSFNLLDNMDGLSGTVSFICGSALLICALQTGQFFIAALLLALMGAVAAFLIFNFPPASIFLGDSGSTFIGYMLGTTTVLTTFMIKGVVHPLFPLLVPLIIFAVPIYDTLSVMVIRFHHERPLLTGDRNHLSHRLYRLGMNKRRVLGTIALMTVATSLGATIPYGSPVWKVIVPGAQALAALCVLLQLELASAEIHYPKEK